ncbi:MAG: hypothetical protein ABL876_18685 [Chitinophagaceae bacterium]
MKKLLIGLLVVAAGAGAFFFFNKKKNNNTASINKEFIIGKWKPAANQPVIDTIQPLYQFDFQKDGIAMRSLSDSAKADTAHYEWNKANELVVKEKATDTTGATYVVVRLTADTLQLQSKGNNVNMLLTKAK